MTDIHIYLLKVSLGLAIIALPYYFLLRNDPNLALKRFYLMLGLLASWIFPLIVFRKPDLFVNLTPTVFIDPTAGDPAPLSLSEAATGTGIIINWIKILISVYLAGLAFMFIKNIFVITKLNLTWLKTRDENGVAFTRSDQVFTLFTRIFIPKTLRDKEDLESILLHERAHVQQLHFVDLTLMELTLLLTWFNPFSWLISRMIKENHEHMADRQVLSTGVNPAHYRAQLLNHTLGVNVFRLGNQFNHSLTIKRFKMMKKPLRSPIGTIKIALLIPAILFSLGFATGMTPQQKPVKGKVVLAGSGEPVPGASVITADPHTGAFTNGTITDIEGVFVLNVEGDPDIVVSFVGYKTIRVKASKITNKPLALEQETYEMDLESVPVMVRKTEHGEVTMRTRVDDPDKPPVMVVDGKVVPEIESIDPENIASIQVIKSPDAEETKKYNATHVILITTKEGAMAKKAPKKDKTSKKKSEKTDVLEATEAVFYIVEDMPSFPGGKAALKTYIYSNLEYPPNMKKGVSGEVMVQFTVEATGKLEDIKVVRSFHKDFNAPALKVFEGMPDWIPGKQRGKPLNVLVSVPVKFQIEE